MQYKVKFQYIFCRFVFFCCGFCYLTVSRRCDSVSFQSYKECSGENCECYFGANANFLFWFSFFLFVLHRAAVLLFEHHANPKDDKESSVQSFDRLGITNRN